MSTVSRNCKRSARFGSMAQQLVARIKKSSKYAYQSPEGDWFEVQFRNWSGDRCDAYTIHCNSNDYRVCDLAFGVRLDNGKIVKLQ
jgi:hypothetical protein